MNTTIVLNKDTYKNESSWIEKLKNVLVLFSWSLKADLMIFQCPSLAPTHLPPKNRQIIFADFVNFPDFFLENSAKNNLEKIGKICIYVCTYYIGMYVGIIILQIFCLFFSKNREKYFLQIIFFA